MKDPDKPIKELMERADYALSHYGEVLVLIDVARDAYGRGEKPNIVKKLEEYGTIREKENPDWSRLIVLRPRSMDSLEKLATDYYRNGKLAGVEGDLEIDTKSVVYCRKTLDNYLDR